MLFSGVYQSPLGEIRLLADQNFLFNLALSGQSFPAQSAEIVPALPENTPVLRETCAWLEAYFAGKKPSISSIPLALQGTGFRLAVWELLKQIPYGKIRTYGDLAAEIASQQGIEKMSARAVGGAVGSNPISIIIPCHRVIGTKGNLTGYGGGLDLKIRLLRHEGVDPGSFNLPGIKQRK